MLAAAGRRRRRSYAARPRPHRIPGAPMTYVAADDRYERMQYRRCGRSGLQLPAISLGLWHNFGRDRTLDSQRAILRRAFDLGITHFDLANNYGPPPGSAEENFGRLLGEDLAAVPRRAHHLHQGRLRHVAGAVRRVGIAQVPARQPRPEPRAHGPRLRRHLLLAPLRPRDAARGDDGRAGDRGAAGQGAVRRHLVVLAGARRARRWRSCAAWACRCSSTSPRTRCSTAGSRTACSTCWSRRASAASRSRRSPRACSPTATCRASPRAAARSENRFLSPDSLTDQAMDKVRALSGIAERRGQTARADGAGLDAARPARDVDARRRVAASSSSRPTSGALERLDFSADELAEIDRYATESSINLWACSSES